jgi:hypothetical protein
MLRHVNDSLPQPSAASCSVVRDYLSLIDVARQLGPKKGTPPIISIMMPPPLWRDSAYGMNQTILNDIMPLLVPEIAALAKLLPPIDVFTPLGALKHQSIQITSRISIYQKVLRDFKLSKTFLQQVSVM